MHWALSIDWPCRLIIRMTSALCCQDHQTWRSVLPRLTELKGAFKCPLLSPHAMTQGVWLRCAWSCSDRKTHCVPFVGVRGRSAHYPETANPASSTLPVPHIPLCTRPEKSSSSGAATVKPLLCTVPVRERAALSSILSSHMVRLFREVNCIISWPLVWKHDHILNSRLPVTSWFTWKHIRSSCFMNLTKTLWPGFKNKKRCLKHRKLWIIVRIPADAITSSTHLIMCITMSLCSGLNIIVFFLPFESPILWNCLHLLVAAEGFTPSLVLLEVKHFTFLAFVGKYLINDWLSLTSVNDWNGNHWWVTTL